MIIDQGTYDDFKLNVFQGWQETIDALLLDFANYSKFTVTEITYQDALVNADMPEVTVSVTAPFGMTKFHANMRIDGYAIRKPVPLNVDLIVRIQDGDGAPFTFLTTMEKSAPKFGVYAGVTI